jgi:hypothetical protein
MYPITKQRGPSPLTSILPSRKRVKILGKRVFSHIKEPLRFSEKIYLIIWTTVNILGRDIFSHLETHKI